MTIRSLDALALFYRLPIEEVIIRAKRLRHRLGAETNPILFRGTIVPSWPANQERLAWAKGRKKPASLEQAFGQVITRYREKRGLSQMDLAVATGYSLRYVGDLERGAKSATLRTMNDLATLLKMSLSSLLTEAEIALGW